VGGGFSFGWMDIGAKMKIGKFEEKLNQIRLLSGMPQSKLNLFLRGFEGSIIIWKSGSLEPGPTIGKKPEVGNWNDLENRI